MADIFHWSLCSQSDFLYAANHVFIISSFFSSHQSISLSPCSKRIPKQCGPTVLPCFSQPILALKSPIKIFISCDLQLLYNSSSESEDFSMICSSASVVGAYATIMFILKGLAFSFTSSKRSDLGQHPKIDLESLLSKSRQHHAGVHASRVYYCFVVFPELTIFSPSHFAVPDSWFSFCSFPLRRCQAFLVGTVFECSMWLFFVFCFWRFLHWPQLLNDDRRSPVIEDFRHRIITLIYWLPC